MCMPVRLWIFVFVIMASHSFCATAQSPTDYDALVQQGKSQLQSGNNDAALVSANNAIRLNRNRWDAHALAGGALINLRRCSEARTELDEAAKSAPADKQSALKSLMNQCQDATPNSSAGAVQSNDPTLKETSDWLTQALEDYGGDRGPNPSTITNVGIDNACTLHYTEHTISSNADDRKWFENADVTVPLGAVTGLQEYYFEGHRLDSDIVLMTGQINAIQSIKSGYKTEASRGTFSSLHIPVQRHPTAQAGGLVAETPQQVLPRIEKALQHAITLCQGTYKARPTKKDIF